jgi:putative colanic acid biosynthesis acetyltransferase WcaF
MEIQPQLRQPPEDLNLLLVDSTDRDLIGAGAGGNSFDIAARWEPQPLLETQDLQRFALPDKFRGRSSVLVQLWWLVQSTLFRGSPQFMYGWRSFLLQLFGARIGTGVLVRPTARITYPWNLSIGDYSWIGDFAELYTLDKIDIGRCSVVSQHVYICTGSHDTTRSTFDITRKPIRIEDQVWIAAGTFVHPGVTIRSGSVVGAHSVLNTDTEPYALYTGAPAKLIGERITRSTMPLRKGK